MKLEIYLKNSDCYDQISHFYEDVSEIRIGENIDPRWLLNLWLILTLE